MPRHQHSNDQEVLTEAQRLQGDTRAALQRMQHQAAETTQVGSATLAALQEQRATAARSAEQTERLHGNLDETDRLQNRLGRFSLFNGRRRANREAARDAAQQEKQAATAERLAPKVSRDEKLAQKLTSAQERREAKFTLDNLAIGDEEEEDVEDKNSSNAEKEEGHRQITAEKKTETAPTSTRTTRTKASSKSRARKSSIDDQLAELDAADGEIDQALDGIGSQLDTLLNMATEQGTEMRAQSAALDEVDHQVGLANVRQKAVNKRTRRFLTGKLRDSN
jgi:hypothetical protein